VSIERLKYPQSFDPAARMVLGEMLPLAQNVFLMQGNPGHGAYSASENGTVVFREGEAIEERQLVWMDRSGKRLGAATKPAALSQALGGEISPDGKRFAFAIGGMGRGADVWIEDLDRGSRTRFTFLPGVSRFPIWSPDGSSLVFSHGIPGAANLYRKSVNGEGKEELIGKLGVNGFPMDWSPDGKWIVYRPVGETTGSDLWLFPMFGEHKPVPYLVTSAEERQSRFSPDGRWLAYTSNESGQDQVYVQAVPITGAKWQVSATGGVWPSWRRDGKELFYASADRKMMVVPVKIGANFEAGTPQALFDLGPVASDFTATADGQRFLVNMPAGVEISTPPLTVMLNWQAGLKK